MRGWFQARGGITDVLRGYAWLLAILIPLCLGAFFIFFSFLLRPSAAVSSFVQAHGVRREAVILSVDNIASQSVISVGTGSGAHTVTKTTYTADVLVSLADPVDGRARTTVHVPRYETAGPGGTLSVLVDPDDPGYAELPGSPSTAAAAPTVFLIVGAGLVVVTITVSALIARPWRRISRRARMSAPAP